MSAAHHRAQAHRIQDGAQPQIEDELKRALAQLARFRATRNAGLPQDHPRRAGQGRQAQPCRRTGCGLRRRRASIEWRRDPRWRRRSMSYPPESARDRTELDPRSVPMLEPLTATSEGDMVNRLSVWAVLLFSMIACSPSPRISTIPVGIPRRNLGQAVATAQKDNKRSSWRSAAAGAGGRDGWMSFCRATRRSARPWRRATSPAGQLQRREQEPQVPVAFSSGGRLPASVRPGQDASSCTRRTPRLSSR